MKPLTREQARRVDRLAEDELGVPGIVLMENAGRNAADAIADDLSANRGLAIVQACVHIYCGGGNNGGDGYVVARHLHNRGAAVHLFAHKPVDQLEGDAGTNAHICRRMGLPIHATNEADRKIESDGTPRPSVVVDALLGTGFQGQLRPDLLNVIRTINAMRSEDNPPRIVALDIPSGLDCDTGEPAQAVVHADLTVTFVAPKQGFASPVAQQYLGEVRVADIGTPPGLTDRA